MAEERTLIRGGTVITVEPGVPDQVADILIDGDQITAVGPDLNVADGSARIVDATDQIVIPGFIDTHRHVYQILLRGLGSNWSLMQYATSILPAGAHFTPEDLYLANRLGALDAIDSGVTALFDWSQNQTTPEHTVALIAGLEAASIRAHFGGGMNLVDLDESTMTPQFLSTVPMNEANVRRLRERYPSDTGLLTI